MISKALKAFGVPISHFLFCYWYSRLPPKRKSLPIPPSPYRLAPNPRFNGTKDTEDHDKRRLHVSAKSEAIEAELGEFWFSWFMFWGLFCSSWLCL